MNQALIQQARQANLAEYLLSVGEPLIKNGNRYRHAQHDSLIFTENAYFWNSQQECGNSVDYLTKHMNMTFPSAVIELTYNSPSDELKMMSNLEFTENDLLISCDKSRVIKYLHKDRHISQFIIDRLFENKLLFQEQLTNNAVFPINDENNIIVGAEFHGTTYKRFKGIKSGSKSGYGFHVQFSSDNTFDYALFFESAIDLISFIDYKFNHGKKKKTLNRCILVSMGGLKLNVIHHTLQAFKGDLQVVLCVDNDKAGHKFKDSVKEENISFIDRSPDEKFKDWNDQIKAWNGSTPMARLFYNSKEKNNIKDKSIIDKILTETE